LQQDVPETKLNLKLQGVLHSDNQVEALALIRLDNGKSAVLGVGAPIHDKPNAPQIYAIYADKVIIRRNGRYETLSLAGTDSKQQKQLIQRSQASPAVPSARQSNNSGKLAQYRRQIMQNPGNLAQYIRMQPAKQNGQFIGYILRPGREAGVLQEFGLQSGDIVTAVNGIVLDSAFKMEALQQLSEASSVNLQILRNGSSLSMNLSVAP
jgi:general secretion pathway protein C